VTAFRVDPASAELRRGLGPVAWFVLEELLLGDGEASGETFVARASARSLAAAVSLNKDTVARALASLAGAGLVEQLPQSNDAGRFASGGYRVAACPGVTRLDDTSSRDEAPTRPHRPATAPRHASTQLTLLDVASADDALALTALPESPQPSDALAPGGRCSPVTRSRDENVSGGGGLRSC